MAQISLYGLMKMAEHAFRNLNNSADQFRNASGVANQRMGAAPAVRDEIAEIASGVAKLGEGARTWWPACKELHKTEIGRVEDPVEGSVRKEVSRDRGPALRET